MPAEQRGAQRAAASGEFPSAHSAPDPDGTGTATARAHPNIALVKYWGKRDEELVLPCNSSLSLTLDVFPTTTRVRVSPELETDAVTLDGVAATGERLRRVVAFLDLLRERAGSRLRATVDTRNTVPTGAGLASSASGFAALATAGAAAYGVRLDGTELSRLARRGSGSAARSVFDGFAVWHAGEGTGEEGDGSSYAEPVSARGLDPALVVALVDTGPKSISSRAAMRHTVETSPLHPAWATSAGSDLSAMRAALLRGDLDAVGEIAERNALGMHATMLAARPAVRYLAPATLAVLDAVRRLREDGHSAYATMDAGPNVKVLCHRSDAQRVVRAVRAALPGRSLVTAGSGPGVRLLTGPDER